MAELTVDLINFPCSSEPSDWPSLQCGEQPDQLALKNGNLQLEADREILFQGDGQLRSSGHLRILTGDPSSTEKLRILANGNVGIGISNPAVKLQVSGDIRTEGALRVTGDANVESNLSVAGDITANGVIRATDAFRPSTDDWEIAHNGEDLEIREPEQRDKVWARFKDDTSLHLIGTPNLWVNGSIGVGTTNPRVKLHITGGRDAELGRGGGFLVVGNMEGTNISLDSNEILARNNEEKSTLFLQANGGDLAIHSKQAEATEFRIKDNGNVGIGTASPVTQLHIRGSKAGPAHPDDHIVFIENTAGGSADVLALKINKSKAEGKNNFITFYDRNKAVGAIQGRSDGSAHLHSGSADYAEWLPRLQEDEIIEPSDIVGVSGGQVTKVTEAADHVMAISSGPIVLGNMPSEEQEHLYEQVAFLGQIRIKVRGAVRAGDYIIPSGLNDGTGVAIPPQELTLAHDTQIVGRAWTSSDEQGVKLINVAVGFQPSHSRIVNFMATLQEEIKVLKATLEKLTPGLIY